MKSGRFAMETMSNTVEGIGEVRFSKNSITLSTISIIPIIPSFIVGLKIQ